MGALLPIMNLTNLQMTPALLHSYISDHVAGNLNRGARRPKNTKFCAISNTKPTIEQRASILVDCNGIALWLSMNVSCHCCPFARPLLLLQFNYNLNTMLFLLLSYIAQSSIFFLLVSPVGCFHAGQVI